MKSRIRFGIEANKPNVTEYLVQPSLLGGHPGKFVVKRATLDYDCAVAVNYVPAAAKIMEIVKKIFKIEGIESVTVYDHRLLVEKIALAEWLDDGIHEAIVKILKEDLYPGEKDIEVSAVEGRNFPGK